MSSSDSNNDGPQTACPDFEDFEQYLYDKLDHVKRSSLEEHLSSCASCTALIEEMGKNNRMLEQMRASQTQTPTDTQADMTSLKLTGYEILRTIYEGGQGVVYEAKQLSTHRNVAIKVLLHGRFAGKMQRRRFEREIDLTAPLDHPNIVPVFDSGRTDDGYMFLVMRYVEGQPLDVFLQHNTLGIAEVLTLFQKIAGAVHYAHQHGVIHRDLKPSNILIDKQWEPHLLDFGLAKPLDDIDSKNRSIQTQAGEFLGTLAYAAPEQVSGDPLSIDVRSDVYSLGVILYEALTGDHPYPIRGQLVDIVRNILDHEPARPSSIRSEINDELDTILLKILSKDKQRRYQSVADLARDLTHLEQGLPIDAKADSTLYVLRKTLRRHRIPVVTALIVFLALMAATITSFSFWQHTQTALEQSEIEANKAKAVNEFLNSDLLAAAGPLHSSNREITMREVLDAASERVAGKFEGQPETAASIHRTLGTTYENLGEYELAEPHHVEALKLYREALGENHLYVFDAMEDLALIYRRLARYDDAEDLFTMALAGKRELLGNEHFETSVSMNDLATLYHTQGRHEEAELLYLESLEVRRQLFVSEHEEIAACECNLANLYEIMGRYDEAEAMHLRALETRKLTLGEDHPQTLMSMNSLAKAYNSKKKYDQAEPLLWKVMDVRRITLGEDHPETLKTMNNLAVLCKEHGNYEEAEVLWSEVLTAQRRVLGEQHPHTLVSANNLADLYHRMERYEESAALFATTIVGARESLPEGHWYTGVFLYKYGLCLTSMERFDDAETTLKEAYQNLSASLGADHNRTRTVATALTNLYQAWDKPEQANRYRALADPDSE